MPYSSSSTDSLIQKMLSNLLRGSAPGPKPAEGDPTIQKKLQKRRVLRKDQTGIAKKVARVFEAIMSRVNQVHGLDEYPLNLRDTLSFMQEGTPILEECKAVSQTKVLAQSQLDLLSGAGRANVSAVLGVMAQPNKKGKLKPKEVAALTGKSESWIRACRQGIKSQGLGAFGATSKSLHGKVQKLCPTRLQPEKGECEDQHCRLLHDCQCCKDGSQCAAFACKNWDAGKALRADMARVARISKLSRRTCDEAEPISTQKWMCTENPARSGDKIKVCWMIKGRFDFYHENYRSHKRTHLHDGTHSHTHTHKHPHTHTHT